MTSLRAKAVSRPAGCPTMSGVKHRVAASRRSPGLLVNRTYERFDVATRGAEALLPFRSVRPSPRPPASTTQSPNLCDGSLVDQASSMAGAAGRDATYQNELYRAGTTVERRRFSLAACSVQYGSATGADVAQIKPTFPGSIPAGGYFLIQESLGRANGALLPVAM